MDNMDNDTLSDFWVRHKFSNVSVYGCRSENENEIEDKGSFYITSDIAYNLLLSLGSRIQEESLNLLGLMGKDNDFDRISDFIFQKFKLDDFDSGSLEKAIVKRLNKLKNYDKTYLLINYIRTALMSLRKERIEFWEIILQMYRLSKNEFDHKVMNKRRKFSFELGKAIREFPERLGEIEKQKMQK